MENNWVGMLIVAVVAFSILGISAYRKRRIDPQLETFAQAYCCLLYTSDAADE